MTSKWVGFTLMAFHSLHEFSRNCWLCRDLVETKILTDLFSAVGIQNHTKTSFP